MPYFVSLEALTGIGKVTECWVPVAVPGAALPVVEVAPAEGDRPCDHPRNPRLVDATVLKDDARAVGAGTAGQSWDEEVHEALPQGG